MSNRPAQISLEADIELEAFVSSAVIAEFSRSTTGAMNLRVGIDIPLFPNRYNVILLKDITGQREPILAQCTGFYDPDVEEKAAGEVAMVRLDRNLTPLPEAVLERLTAADPRVIEGGESGGTSFVEVGA